MQEPMCNINKDRNSKSQKEVLENKNTIAEIKSASHGLLVDWHNWRRISEPEAMSKETKAKRKYWKN